MTCVDLGKFGVLCVEPDYWVTDRTRKDWRFEWHRVFGPSALHKKTAEVLKPPGARSAFWDAVLAWDVQGRRTETRDGKTWALWDPNPEAKK